MHNDSTTDNQTTETADPIASDDSLFASLDPMMQKELALRVTSFKADVAFLMERGVSMAEAVERVAKDRERIYGHAGEPRDGGDVGSRP